MFAQRYVSDGARLGANLIRLNLKEYPSPLTVALSGEISPFRKISWNNPVLNRVICARGEKGMKGTKGTLILTVHCT